MRRLGLLLVFACAACGDTDTTPTASLGSPVALVAAPSTNPGAAEGFVLMMASADDDELRAFLPGTELFARGPNAISPLSIPVGFRPERLAAGSTADGLHFAVAAGAASALTTVETAGFRVTRAAGDAATCAAGGVAASCLPGLAVDVAAGGSKVFAAVISATAGGTASLVVFDAVSEGGAPVLALNTVIPLTGRPAGLASTADGSRVFVGDIAGTRVVEVTVAGGAMRDITASGPVSDVFVVPAYTSAGGTAHPEAEYLLALLSNGNVQTLSPSAGGPAPDPLTPTAPIVPLSFATPVRDLTFVPCLAAAPCTVTLQVSSTETRQEPLLAFVGLGDGSVVPLVPDATRPQVFRPVEESETGASAGAVSYTGDPENAPTLVVDGASLTEGFTIPESIRVTFQALLPGFTQRQGTIDGVTLTDAAGGFLVADVRAGDVVVLSGPTGCTGDVVVAAVAAGTLTLATPATTQPTACLYAIRAVADAPWVVVGSLSGLIGRATTDVRFVNAGTRFFYPQDIVDGPAFAFTIAGPNPPLGEAFTFTTSSGFTPLSLAVEQSLGFGQPGLANAVAAIPGKVFATLLSTNELVSFLLAEATQSTGQQRFR